jgi:hypothetical protein
MSVALGPATVTEGAGHVDHVHVLGSPVHDVVEAELAVVDGGGEKVDALLAELDEAGRVERAAVGLEVERCVWRRLGLGRGRGVVGAVVTICFYRLWWLRSLWPREVGLAVFGAHKPEIEKTTARASVPAVGKRVLTDPRE